MSFFESLKGYKKIKKLQPAKIVFYSEGKAYYTNFAGIIDELIKAGEKVIYVTSSIDDPVLEKETEYFIPVYIESTFFLILFFNYLRTEIFITTLPDIDTFHLKKSPYVQNMIYVHHSIVSMNMIYLPKAFESYDTIFCVGPYHIAECREMEDEYGTKRKKLIKAGYPALDNFINEYNNYKENNGYTVKDKKVICIAPSWHKDNIIDLCIFDMIDSLLEENFIVRLRPHPKTLKEERGKLDKIVKHYKENTNFKLDDTPGNFKTYSETDLMITDWSGTVYKYTFATYRPVIFINTPTKIRNPKYASYKNVPIDISWREIIGKSMNMEDIRKTGQVALSLLDNIQEEKIKSFIETNIYNIGTSSKYCAEYIINEINKKDRS